MATRLTTAVMLLFVGICFIACANGKGIIGSRLQKRFLDGGDGSTENVMVSFDQSIEPVFEQINQMNFTDDNEKRTAQTEAQQQFTEESQRGLKSLLEAQGVQSESFWIDNQMYVPNASPNLVNTIASFPGVAGVEEEKTFQIDAPAGFELPSNNRSVRQSSSTWGIQKIRADQVWSYYQGQGVVVANIDTGVRYTHETLRNNWRSSYGWYDPYWGTSTPDDRQGHGTHVMGTIAGSGGIGVAPQSTWIACRGCSDRGCTESALKTCGQWIQCPTDPNGRNQDCSKAPQVVCNSWGGGQGDTGYAGIVRSWHNSGIIPVFAIGNSGPNCNSANSPGDLPDVLAVGNTDRNDRINGQSSLGPGPSNRLKPDISAPGTDIISASHSADNRYRSLSGTSMAAPHVTGVVALMKERRPSLNYNQIYSAITRNPNTNLDSSSARTCGGRPGTSYPNNVFGYGLIDTINVLNAV